MTSTKYQVPSTKYQVPSKMSNSNANATNLKGLMAKLTDKSLMTDELDLFFTKELLDSLQSLSIKDTKPLVVNKGKAKAVKAGESESSGDGAVKPKRKLTDHNKKVAENIPFIKLYHPDISHQDRFSLAAMMSKIERLSQEDMSKEEAMLQAGCNLNQKKEHLVIVCDCVVCNKL